VPRQQLVDTDSGGQLASERTASADGDAAGGSDLCRIGTAAGETGEERLDEQGRVGAVHPDGVTGSVGQPTLGGKAQLQAGRQDRKGRGEDDRVMKCEFSL
jgi:hypothetical protein